MSELQRCYNRGCGQEFDPKDNKDDSCRHHPGAPFFHDSYKGWSCCQKKSVDFTEFLSIKGCTLSKHSNVKPPEAEKPQKDDSIAEAAPIPAPIKRMERPSFDEPLVKLEPKVDGGLKKTIDNLTAEDLKNESNGQSKDGEVAVGTKCRNTGCDYAYSGTSTDYGECVYHPGVPIFHEGMKYWSCCQKKTSIFSEFMAQKGCANGQHKWVSDDEESKKVQCRYDWHQTATNVHVVVYAKLYHYAKSTIEINPIRLKINLVFPKQNDATFHLDTELKGIVDVSQAKVQMYSTKVEITLPKAEPGSWAKLNIPRTIAQAPPKEEPKESEKNMEAEDELNLDDVEPVSTGFRLTELASTKTH